ncbi:FecR domain-containing protein [Chitinophaga horti]|uniref:FecR domain-containing protein n=1 Tax=Chitinophaga horti TaxID=2920382 RepID=A0ABY6J5W0_9BACT|nr:FecR domain-containing protein [Chitinophaga horti]UYQ95007.1 FecR domain-containing protein [Chitinophaga horti]
MRNLSSLINKYQDGTASVDELYALLNLLDEQEQELYKEWESAIRNNIASLSAPVTGFDQEKNKAAILSKLRTMPEQRPDVKIRRLFSRNSAIAAACTGLVVLLSVLYWHNQPGGKKEAAIMAAANATTVIHAPTAQKTIWLEDSSEVFLYAGSTLGYDSSYNMLSRKLVLNGSARFTVKKDKNRPFVVYTKNNMTTALGTVFEVTATGDSTIVYLLEGAVKVQALNGGNKEQVILAPQQRALTYNRQTTVMRDGGEKLLASSSKRSKAAGKTGNLTFKQVTLVKVLTTLEHKYKVNIEFDKAELAGMLFTGTFQEHEELQSILEIIAKINNLTITTNNQGFSITK